MLGLKYKILYKKGVENKVADALSRRCHVEKGCSALTAFQPTWVNPVIASYEADEKIAELLTHVAVDPNASTDYTCKQGLLYYKGRLVVGKIR